MKLTTRSEYALLALIFLARHDKEEPVSGEIIAQEQGIPPKFLQQILLALKRAHYIRSAKGQRGGYLLAKKPHEISIRHDHFMITEGSPRYYTVLTQGKKIHVDIENSFGQYEIVPQVDVAV